MFALLLFACATTGADTQATVPSEASPIRWVVHDIDCVSGAYEVPVPTDDVYTFSVVEHYSDSGSGAEGVRNVTSDVLLDTDGDSWTKPCTSSMGGYRLVVTYGYAAE